MANEKKETKAAAKKVAAKKQAKEENLSPSEENGNPEQEDQNPSTGKIVSGTVIRQPFVFDGKDYTKGDTVKAPANRMRGLVAAGLVKLN